MQLLDVFAETVKAYSYNNVKIFHKSTKFIYNENRGT